jgi:hypothetical protein
MPYVEYGMQTPMKAMMAKVPNVAAWWNRVRERGTWQKVVGKA